jgi:hypothetical protein
MESHCPLDRPARVIGAAAEIATLEFGPVSKVCAFAAR